MVIAEIGKWSDALPRGSEIVYANEDVNHRLGSQTGDRGTTNVVYASCDPTTYPVR
jgi:hypothetical protein